MGISAALAQRLDALDRPVRQAFYAFAEEQEKALEERITRRDFDELRQIVTALAVSQKELAAAQNRTEARLDSLAQRVEELTEAQKRTETRVEELAAAQKRTEEEVRSLAKAVKQLQKDVGGLSVAVGFGIEDDLMPFIPAFARKEYGVEVTSVERTNVEYANGKFDEVNILAQGRDAEGRPVFLVAECKAQPGKKDLDRFAGMLRRLAEVLDGTLHPLFIAYAFDPKVERYACHTHPHIRCIKTYQLQRLAGERAWAA